ncbi:DUF1868 domain-containing protein [Oceanibium sediminis]|uniref:DUF1868 domain-containing protein n=1 Tax=Oceanibium sediminis TaxID=2026339 RepID=UPI000DD4CC49|nr:DUF1868 domain-containing protein [Oceanibium sediminis]
MRPDLAAFARRSHDGPPDRLGRRYDSRRFLSEAGNTVVCHLDREDPAHEPVLEARARMQALPGADALLFTPADSLHMTVFDGVIETQREADAWPAGLDCAAPINAVTDVLLQRLPGFAAPPAFSVSAVNLLPTGLLLDGATAADTRVLWRWRDTLTAPFGFRRPEHDSYRFHMTFAYPLRWLDDDEASRWEDALGEILADLRRAAPVIPLRAPAFCRFADMTHFEELLVLGR